MARGGTPEQAAKATFRDVFAVTEFRALWLAQFLSVVGDQLARVALTVLVFDRTQSALLAAATFVVSIVPAFVGGITLAWLADRHPRRTVMIVCDLLRCALVLVMIIPGMPLAGMVALLFAVTLAGAPFTSARAAVYTDVLDGERYVLGTAIGLTTLQFAQVVGFAAGGTSVGFLGARVSLVIDAATFAVSALLIQGWVRLRAAPAAAARPQVKLRSVKQAMLAGSRLVFASQVLRTTMLFGWLAAFYDAPEGVATPLARALGGGALAVGAILAAQALGQTSGMIVFSRFVAPPTRLRSMGPLAVAACAALVLFAWRPGLLLSLLILFVSGSCASYQLAANSGFVSATPPERRGQAFGLAQGGMSLGQGTVMILAGAAADHHSPALVIAVCGATGAALAVVLTISWLRGRSRPGGRHKRALTGQVHRSTFRSSPFRARFSKLEEIGGNKGVSRTRVSGPAGGAHVAPPLGSSRASGRAGVRSSRWCAWRASSVSVLVCVGVAADQVHPVVRMVRLLSYGAIRDRPSRLYDYECSHDYVLPRRTYRRRGWLTRSSCCPNHV